MPAIADVIVKTISAERQLSIDRKPFLGHQQQKHQIMMRSTSTLQQNEVVTVCDCCCLLKKKNQEKSPEDLSPSGGKQKSRWLSCFGC